MNNVFWLHVPRLQTKVPDSVQKEDQAKLAKLDAEMGTIEEAIAAFKKLELSDQ